MRRLETWGSGFSPLENDSFLWICHIKHSVVKQKLEIYCLRNWAQSEVLRVWVGRALWEMLWRLGSVVLVEWVSWRRYRKNKPRFSCYAHNTVTLISDMEVQSFPTHQVICHHILQWIPVGWSLAHSDTVPGASIRSLRLKAESHEATFLLGIPVSGPGCVTVLNGCKTGFSPPLPRVCPGNMCVHTSVTVTKDTTEDTDGGAQAEVHGRGRGASLAPHPPGLSFWLLAQ